jgi:hypothetical protein
MPGFATDYLKSKQLNQLLAAATFAIPGTLYFGLSTQAANKTGLVTEPSGGTYARTAVTSNSTNWPVRTDGTSLNGTTISINAAAGSAGTALSIFVADASSGGNVLFSIDIAPAAVGPGASAVTFAAGAIRLG